MWHLEICNDEINRCFLNAFEGNNSICRLYATIALSSYGHAEYHATIITVVDNQNRHRMQKFRRYPIQCLLRPSTRIWISRRKSLRIGKPSGYYESSSLKLSSSLYLPHSPHNRTHVFRSFMWFRDFIIKSITSYLRAFISRLLFKGFAMTKTGGQVFFREVPTQHLRPSGDSTQRPTKHYQHPHYSGNPILGRKMEDV